LKIQHNQKESKKKKKDIPKSKGGSALGRRIRKKTATKDPTE